MAKGELRVAARARLEGANPSLGEQLAAHVLQPGLRLVPERAAVAGVWPLGREIDLRPLLVALHELGHPILLPETTPRGSALIFRHWAPGSVMIEERFGTFRPAGEIGMPDLLFVPLLAFDRAGNRLGYGGGYYDRTLAALPGRTAIGFGYACQEVDRLPAEPHDRPLDAIATELGVHIVDRRT